MARRRKVTFGGSGKKVSFLFKRKAKPKCPMCNRKIEKPTCLRIYQKTTKGKVKFERDIPYCSKFCAKLASIIWLGLVKGCSELKGGVSR